MLISVIIPAYNSASTISEALDSVVEQTLWKSGHDPQTTDHGRSSAVASAEVEALAKAELPTCEIIVVDDASTDNTVEMVRNWAERQGRQRTEDGGQSLRAEAENVQHSTFNAQHSSGGSNTSYLSPFALHSSPEHRAPNAEYSSDAGFRFQVSGFVACKLFQLARNSGPAAARNRGIAEARGEWIAFLDADDAWLPDKLAIQIDFVAKQPDVALWCGGVVAHSNAAKRADETQKESEGFQVSGFTFQVLPLASFATGNPVATSTVLVKKVAVLTVGGFDEQFRGPEDYDLWMRIAARFSISKIEMPLVQYNQRSGSLSMDDRTFLPEVLRVIEKAFGDSGVLRGLDRLRRTALSTQLWNASWMAFNRGKRLLAMKYWLRSYLLNLGAEKHIRRKWYPLLARYLFGGPMD